MATLENKFGKFFAKKDGAKAGGNGPGIKYHKFEKAGVNYTLRALPWKGGELDGMPMAVRHFHSLNMPDGKFTTVPCRQKTEGESCPFCAAASKLWKEHVQTGSIEKKEAAKSLFAKTQYVAVVANLADIRNLAGAPTTDNLFILNIDSKTNRDIIDERLQMGHDFADFSSGRNMRMKKVAGAGFGSISLVFDDAGEAFDGDRALFDSLVELMPDLNHLLTVSEDEVNKVYAAYTRVPVDSPEPADEYADSPMMYQSSPAVSSLDALRAQMELAE